MSGTKVFQTELEKKKYVLMKEFTNFLSMLESTSNPHRLDYQTTIAGVDIRISITSEQGTFK
jgi:hypothetical protein